jgi:thiol-disulfide isomerase/thioredoxin
MKETILTFLKKWTRPVLLTLAVATLGELPAHALYQAGQTVTNNFYFIARRAFTRPDGAFVPAGARVYLHDFAGRVVFFEWFAVWCPYCIAAAPQVETGIVDWYEARGGNPFGVSVVHVAVNQVSESFYQPQTDNFITQQGFGITVNDYEGNVINSVRYQFITGGQPLFVVINGVTNSPSHLPWQILVNYQGYGQTDFNQTLAGFRTLIDAVQGPVNPAQLTAPRRVGNDFEFSLTTQLNRNYRVQTSSDLVNWATLRTVTGSTNTVLFRETNAPPSNRFYRAVTP